MHQVWLATHNQDVGTERSCQHIVGRFDDCYALFGSTFADYQGRRRQLRVRRIPQREHSVDV